MTEFRIEHQFEYASPTEQDRCISLLFDAVLDEVCLVICHFLNCCHFLEVLFSPLFDMPVHDRAEFAFGSS